MKHNDGYGARIERGEITRDHGKGIYTVKSITREGVYGYEMPYMGGDELKEGDRVYFFLFDDGNGAVLPKNIVLTVEE